MAQAWSATSSAKESSPARRGFILASSTKEALDPTRTRKEPLDKMEIKARIGELFNLADPNYVGLNTIKHTFKLARPPPKVNDATFQL